MRTWRVAVFIGYTIMGAWLRLECKTMFVGWTSELSAEQYAAWIKFLQATKLFGERGGRIQESYFDDRHLQMWNISRNAFEKTISSAVTNGAVTKDKEGYLVITSWNTYQIDPSAATRKAKQRTKDVTHVTGTTVCHDDVTVPDPTGKDVTLQPDAITKKKAVDKVFEDLDEWM